jgi:hypothetical protein
MAYWVRFADIKDIEWLQKITNKFIGYLEIGKVYDDDGMIVRVHEALHDHKSSEEALNVIEADLNKQEQAKEERKKERSTKTPAATVAVVMCDTHKKYQAKRVPNTDCSECWVAYKKYNPMKYDKARRDFERKNS